MAKIAFTKLALTRNSKIEILEWNNQKIEVKQYLPIEEKLDLISRIMSFSIDDNAFYNPCRLDIFELIQIILTYTNINLTQKQNEDISKLYDLFVSSGFANAVKQLIPDEEITYIHTAIDATIKEIYRYRDSVMGIMEQVTTDQRITEDRLNEVIEQIKNSEEIKDLKKMTTQLG